MAQQTRDIQKKIDRLIDRAQDDLLEASRQLSKGISRETERIVPPVSKDIERIVDDVFDFAERVVKGQRKMVGEVVKALNEQTERAEKAGREASQRVARRARSKKAARVTKSASKRSSGVAKAPAKKVANQEGAGQEAGLGRDGYGGGEATAPHPARGRAIGAVDGRRWVSDGPSMPPDTDPAPPAFPVHYVAIHGHRIAYRRGGRGPVLLLLHGIAGSSQTWIPAMELLARKYTVVAPDFVGHGHSAKPSGDYSLGNFANWMRDLMTVLDIDRATVVGQSFGGGVAMQFAYQFPERCERLVLVDAGGLGRDVNWVLRLVTLPAAEYVLPVVFPSFVRPGATASPEWPGGWGSGTCRPWRSGAPTAP